MYYVHIQLELWNKGDKHNNEITEAINAANQLIKVMDTMLGISKALGEAMPPNCKFDTVWAFYKSLVPESNKFESIEKTLDSIKNSVQKVVSEVKNLKQIIRDGQKADFFGNLGQYEFTVSQAITLLKQLRDKKRTEKQKAQDYDRMWDKIDECAMIAIKMTEEIHYLNLSPNEIASFPPYYAAYLSTSSHFIALVSSLRETFKDSAHEFGEETLANAVKKIHECLTQMAMHLRANKQNMMSKFRAGLIFSWQYGVMQFNGYTSGEDSSFGLKHEISYTGGGAEGVENNAPGMFPKWVDKMNARVLAFERCIPDVIPPPPFNPKPTQLAQSSDDVASELDGKIVELKLLNNMSVFCKSVDEENLGRGTVLLAQFEDMEGQNTDVNARRWKICKVPGHDNKIELQSVKWSDKVWCAGYWYDGIWLSSKEETKYLLPWRHWIVKKVPGFSKGARICIELGLPPHPNDANICGGQAPQLKFKESNDTWNLLPMLQEGEGAKDQTVMLCTVIS